MRIEWLEAFQMTAETQSLTKASELLHMSQPALSKQIKNLEADLGAPLFTRTTAGVTLTEAGKRLLPVSELILKELKAVKKEIALEEGLKNITIGSWPSIATSYLPGKLALNVKREASANFPIKISHSFIDLLAGLENGQIDVALFDDRDIGHPYYSAPLFSEKFLLYVNKQHPKYAAFDAVMFEDIAKEAFVLLPETCDARTLIQSAFSKKGTVLSVASEIEFGQSILGFIEANIGISILPEIFTKGMPPNVKAIEITDLNIERHISLIAREEKVGKRVWTILK